MPPAIDADALVERMWKAVALGDSDDVYLVLRKAEREDAIASMKEVVDPTTEDGTTPLYVACKHGHTECARQLLAAGAIAGRPTKAGGLTPLWIAAQGGHKRCVELLLMQRGVNVNTAAAKDGRTPLYVASEHGSVPVVKLLLEKGANIEAKRKDGTTPLIVAAYFGRAEVRPAT